MASQVLKRSTVMYISHIFAHNFSQVHLVSQALAGTPGNMSSERLVQIGKAAVQLVTLCGLTSSDNSEDIENMPANLDSLGIVPVLGESIRHSEVGRLAAEESGSQYEITALNDNDFERMALALLAAVYLDTAYDLLKVRITLMQLEERIPTVNTEEMQ